jgi:formamidopyrimidine-DNA glycosylase
MPELPDLEIIRDYLAPRVVGLTIAGAQVRRPLVMRNLLGDDPVDHLIGRTFSGVGRKGKFLLFSLDDGVTLVIHPMLAGRIRHGPPSPRHRARDALVLLLGDGSELRYHDAKDMGKVYLTDDLSRVPDLTTLGPEATSPDLTLEEFRARLREYHGEIKRILTTQTFVAGIGNAYADEICWRARLYPFRRRASLTPDEVAELYAALRAVLAEAIELLSNRQEEAIAGELRDFLAVHGRPGQPCPRCGTAISEVKRTRRATHFCRNCQPGLLVGGR